MRGGHWSRRPPGCLSRPAVTARPSGMPSSTTTGRTTSRWVYLAPASLASALGSEQTARLLRRSFTPLDAQDLMDEVDPPKAEEGKKAGTAGTK